MKTVMITGCSSGYGLETARYFHAQGWTVVATMRAPRDGILPVSDRMRLVALDVTDPASISAALDAAGPLDVLVNNAGVGLAGAFEATPLSAVRQLFETNTFGVMAMAQAVIPQFRSRQSGVLVNVSSSATLMSHPLVAAYTASKTAIDGFSGSLALELAAFNVRVKLIEPGLGPSTSFARNTVLPVGDLLPEAYKAFAGSVFSVTPALVTTACDVAEVIWQATNDSSHQLHYPAGPDAVAMARRRSA